MKLTFQILVITLLLSACSNAPVQSTVPPTVTSTATLQNTETVQPTGTPTLTVTATVVSKKTIAVTKTRAAQLSAEATVAAFGTVCQPPTRDYHAEISPNGRWIAVICRGQYGVADSYLRVVSMQDDKVWSVNHADYAKVEEYNTDGMIYPFHWSKDGKYLYATSPSRVSGCCWIGYNLLLVRLDLENGQQTEIANYISDGSGIAGVDFSVSPSDRYVLYIPQDGKNNLYIMDLQTWKQRIIKLKFENTGAGFTLMSSDEKKIILVLREYPEKYQGDLTFGSLVIIDLVNGSQNRVLSGVDYHDTPIPVHWQDNDHVTVQKNGEYLLLNIITGELTEAEKP